MSAPVVDLEAYRRRPGELLSYRQVCAELDKLLDEVLTEPVDYHLDEETGELDTLPPTAPIDGTWRPVPAVRRVWQ